MNKTLAVVAPTTLDNVRARITASWRRAGHSNPVALRSVKGMTGNADGNSSGISTYSGSDLTNTSGDFLGDWRSADSWMRFDMMRVRYRSRQLERGNPWCRSFKIALINNVLGHKGFKFTSMVKSSPRFGDATEGELDVAANSIIKAVREEYEKAGNFTTRKRLSCQDADRLLLSRLAFDGEIIIRLIPRFDNDFGFTSQIIDPDYLDHNLNRIEPNGNMTKMGVELDKDYKFPVAYWFLRRRPNDYFYNYAEMHNTLWERVPANEVLHIFMQTDDTEQTRGWPWLFAAAVNLHRLGKYQEAALINAAIGASKMGFFKKTIPDGFAGSPSELSDDDDGEIVDNVQPGSWVELPWNVEPVPWDPKYPDAEFDPFNKALLRGIASALGTSYMTLTGDVSDANFSNLRAGQFTEREWYMQLQEFVIAAWKKPEFENFIYRALLTRKLPLPISKQDKFNQPSFRGRRWPYVNPVDDMRGKQLELSTFSTSVTHIIEEKGGDREEVFAQIKRDIDDLVKAGIPLETVLSVLFSGGKMSPTGDSAGGNNTPPAKPGKKKPEK